MIRKSITANAVPVLIARRLPYVSFRLFNSCGMMMFQNYNQMYPMADHALAEAVRVKDDLGYHDVRIGNEPSAALGEFLTKTIPSEAPMYRSRFEKHKDLLADFCSGEMSYASFAARIRRREQGQPEDSDEDPAEYGLNPDDMEPDWEND